MLQQTQTFFLSLQEMHLKSQAGVMLNFGDLTSTETCQSSLAQPTLKLPHLICTLVTRRQKQVLLIFPRCCLYAFSRKDMDNHSILLDIPVLVAVVCLLRTVLRDNLPMSDIKAKQWSRTKPDFLHAVVFKVLEKGGFVWTMMDEPPS